MPLYEDKKNAENIIHISEENRNAVVFEKEQVISEIAEIINGCGEKSNIAFDGWYGVDYQAIINDLNALYNKHEIEFINANMFLKSVDELKAYKNPYITDDPGFGFVNTDGMIEDLTDEIKINEVQAKLTSNTDKLIIVYNSGAAVKPLIDCYDKIFYFDKTMQPLLWQMWSNELIPFGFDVPDNDYNWKEYYYCDFYLLFKHKKEIYKVMDYYVEAIIHEDLKLVPRNTYDEIISTMVKYPIKQVQIFQPGPWGAYRYRDLWEIEGLECSAWNKMSGPELSILIDFGREKMLNLPLLALMQYNEKITGKEMSEQCPDLFPLDIWLDDGYFPDKQPAERTSMPIHNHPSTDYVKQHFNEPLGRYETYYIAEAYEGANTWMGYSDDANLEEWEAKCRLSDNMKVIENWRDYVANWKSNVGDLYLIPPGTAHAHGGNQMVLEMDTSPAVAGTEYSFFQYDFARNSWDDEKKEMTGKQLKMHLEHGFSNEKWRRASYVKENLRARPEIVFWNKEFWMDRYSTLPEMPFEVERLHFYKKAEYSTFDKFVQIVTLTVGKNALIRSKDDHSRQTSIVRLQCATIPASFGEYEILSTDGSFCTCVVFRLKRG